ncbi:MAG: HAD-IB family phosphatase [Halanaerobiaceae bacterium]|nr:HAD-IB family phosphatase [Halanaerobiaceae bacterium]
MRLAIFDFNGTIFPRETLPFLLGQWYGQGRSRTKLVRVFLFLLPLYLRYIISADSDYREEMKAGMVYRFSTIFDGMDYHEILEYFQNAAEEAGKYYNQKIVEEIKKTGAEGYHTVLLSGAFKLLVENVGNDLNFDTVIGSEFSFDKGVINRALKLVSGVSKMSSLLEVFPPDQIDWKDSCAYADSIGDLEILEYVGHPVAVSPDRELRNIARERGWPIIE